VQFLNFNSSVVVLDGPKRGGVTQFEPDFVREKEEKKDKKKGKWER